VVVALLFKNEPAWADEGEPPVLAALAYDPKETCIAREKLASMVETRLQRKIFVEPSKADVVVELALERKTEHWSATLTLRSSAGVWFGARELQSEAEDCSGLDESLALVVALAIDVPKDELPPPPAAAAKPPERPKPRPLRLPPPVERARPSEPAKPWEVAPRVGLAMSAGILPNVSPGARATLRLSPPDFWNTELGATIWKNADETSGDRGSHLSFISAEIAICPVKFGPRSVPMRACLNQTIGRLSAEGFGFSENRERRRFFYMWGLGLRAAWRIAEPVRLHLGVDAAIPATRDDFFYTDASGRSVGVYRVSPIVGVAELGVELGLR
jgi:hypothetical protein